MINFEEHNRHTNTCMCGCKEWERMGEERERESNSSGKNSKVILKITISDRLLKSFMHFFLHLVEPCYHLFDLVFYSLFCFDLDRYRIYIIRQISVKIYLFKLLVFFFLFSYPNWSWNIYVKPMERWKVSIYDLEGKQKSFDFILGSLKISIHTWERIHSHLLMHSSRPHSYAPNA